MKAKTAKHWLLSMIWVSCFILALNAPYIKVDIITRGFIGYSAAFGFWVFAILQVVLFIKRKGV